MHVKVVLTIKTSYCAVWYILKSSRQWACPFYWNSQHSHWWDSLPEIPLMPLTLHRDQMFHAFFMLYNENTMRLSLHTLHITKLLCSCHTTILQEMFQQFSTERSCTFHSVFNWSIQSEIIILLHLPFIFCPPFLISQMNLGNNFMGIIVHHNIDTEMRSEWVLPVLYSAYSHSQKQSKSGSCQCEKPICVQKQNISSANNGPSHSVISSHANRDLIMMLPKPSSSFSIGKEERTKLSWGGECHSGGWNKR